MKSPLLRPLLAGLALSLAPALAAQTWVGGTSSLWEDAPNWNPATVPDSASATAVFNPASLVATGSDIHLASDHTLGAIQYQAGTGHVNLILENSSSPVTLTLAGTGVDNQSGMASQTIWAGPFHDPAYPPATIVFTNQAAAGNARLVAIADNYVVFRRQASADHATIISSHTDFYDTATAGSAVFDPTLSGVITFHDHSTAASAQLPGYFSTITFADSSSAGSASVLRPYAYSTSSQVFFTGASNAGSAAFYVNNLSFADTASAGSALINNAGGQEYSGHGAYSTIFASTRFAGQSTAGSAVIGTNALATLTFTDDATADRARITNIGTVIFDGHSSFAQARLLTGTGTYYVTQGHDQPGLLTTVGRVTFKDQATGGPGTIEITAPGTVLDFSGLYGSTGTTGRALLPATPAGPAIVPDDARTFQLGALTNTVPGGTIYLGGTNLQLGLNNTDMILSAQIKDVGGAYGSAAGEPLRGGGLSKVGSGTLTITNPDNSYASGATGILAGTINLAGGSISNVDVIGTGRLTGSGLVRGWLNNGPATHLGSNAVVSPGNSIGTITVQNAYLQGADGTLNIELASATSYDRLVVGGAATLGGRLNFSLLNGYVPVGSTTFDFLAAAGVNGQFATVSPPPGSSAALSSQLVYAADGVHLQVTQKPFASLGGGSPAAAAFGSALDAAVPQATGSARDLLAGLNTLNAAQLGAALEALAPDRYSVLAENAFATAAATQAAVDRRLAAQPSGTPPPHHAVFFEGGYRRASFDATEMLPAAGSRFSGGTAGIMWHNDHSALGLALGYESGAVDLDDQGSRADVTSLIPQVFFRYAPGRFQFSAAAVFSQDDYELERRIAYEGVSRTALASPSGQRMDLGVTAGYAVPSGAWLFTPYAGVLSSTWQIDDFTETGADAANLAISTGSVRSLRTRLGVEAVRRPTGGSVTPRFVLAWWHEWQDDRSLDASFAGQRYTAPGRPAEEDLVQASLSVDVQLRHHAALYATLGGAWGRNSAITSALSAGFRWEF